MNKREINDFIKEMEIIGDEWTLEQVDAVYGKTSLKDALKHRKAEIESFFDTIGEVISR